MRIGQKNIPFYYLIEALIPLQIVFIIYLTSLGIAGLTDFNTASTMMIRFLAVVIPVDVTIISRMGIADIRSKLLIHLTLITLLGTTQAAMLVPNEGSLFPVSNDLPAFAILAAMNTIMAVSTIFAVFDTISPLSRAIQRVNAEVKRGNLDARITEENILKDNLLSPSAVAVNDILDELSSLVQTLARNAETTSTNMETLGANVEEISASVEEITASTQNMAQGASEQTDILETIYRRQQELSEVVNRIVGQVFENTKVIQDIALKTNILALNAGIEASRAGDYGRGFSIVAANIRSLSESTNESINVIRDTTATIAEQLESYVSQLSADIENVSVVSEETAASAQEVVATMEEISSNISQLSEMATDFSKIVEKSSGLLSKYR